MLFLFHDDTRSLLDWVKTVLSFLYLGRPKIIITCHSLPVHFIMASSAFQFVHVRYSQFHGLGIDWLFPVYCDFFHIYNPLIIAFYHT